ncbi:caspase domain-containing protein [Vararia minispora EC-137]|uniref:Caspase domain-containing protein n=1 Tax=Vararia minispora EC-137 TaxID=1314806 RepID=A0ACB8QUX4_9AGAM|nr:caspase domain-containing protein [Vararia minispora EC-137]
MAGFLKAKGNLLGRRSGHYAWIHDKHCTTPRYQVKRYKALLIAINYERPEEQIATPPVDEEPFQWGKLTGCRNDAQKVERLLIETYRCKDITFMSDEESKRHRDTELYPTKWNILRQLEKLVADSQPGDVLVLFYSGHSGQIKALLDKREKDGKDEYIVSVDGYRILDDHLRQILVEPLPPGRRLTAIFDSCHSGTLLDLEHYAEPMENGRHSHPNTLTHHPDMTVTKMRTSLPEEFMQRFVISTERIRRHVWELASFYLSARRMARRARKQSGFVDDHNASTELPDEEPALFTSDDKTMSVDGDSSSSQLHDASHAVFERPEVHPTVAHADVRHMVRPQLSRAPTRPKRCRACILREKTKVVLSIASCLDSEEAVESVKRKEAFMTPALCKILAEKPEMSAEELALKLQEEMFHNTLKVFIDSRKRVRRVVEPAVHAQRLDRFKSLLRAFGSWQHVQIGSEHPHAIKEPFLVLPSSTSSQMS